MSKEVDQALVALATIAGCAETLEITRAYARVDIKQAIRACFQACKKAIESWPGFSNMYWIKDRREEFKTFIANERDVGHSAVSVVYMCAQVVEDLITEYGHNQEKAALIMPVKAEIDKIVAFCDRNGENFPAMEKSWDLIHNLYLIIDKKEMAKA